MKPLIIGVTGGSGSGKTCIVHKLRDYFQTDELCLISQDNYYLPREQQEQDSKGVTNFDLPSCIDAAAFEQDIQRLLSGEDVILKEYTFNNALATSKDVLLKAAPVIVVEGLFVFYFEAIRRLMDLKVYVEVSDVVKLKRRIIRDQKERNYPLDDVLYRYEHHVAPSYRKYILPYRQYADIVINNEFHYEKGLDVLKSYIKDKLV